MNGILKFTGRGSLLVTGILFLVTLCAGREKATLIVFLDPECPLSQTATDKLNRLAARELKRDRTLEVIGVIPRHETASSEVTDFRERHGIRFELLGDPDLQVAQSVSARVTPEAFLLDSARTLLYRGAVDNRSDRLGKKRNRPTVSYVDSAVSQWENGRTVHPAQTKAVGCFIE